MLADHSATHLDAFLVANLAPASTARTRGWSAHWSVPGIDHDPHLVSAPAGHRILPRVNRTFSDLKVWGLGVYHGLRGRHLQSYLDEFVFRFNRRRARHTAFNSLLGIAAAHQPLTYNMVVSRGGTA